MRSNTLGASTPILGSMPSRETQRAMASTPRSSIACATLESAACCAGAPGSAQT
jgi:hypothetical protein